MTWKPHVTVAAIACRNDSFLMVEEKIDGKMVLNQPAGHLEPGESLLDAVIRETFEETAWQFVPQSIVGLYRWQNPVNSTTFIRICFAGDCIEHDNNQSLDPDIHRTLWLPYEDIKYKSAYLRSPLVLQCIEDYISGRRFPLDIISDLG